MRYESDGIRLHPRLVAAGTVALALTDLARDLAVAATKRYVRRHRPRRGQTLRPGPDTPLWNALTVLINEHLKRYGEQAKLGRVLGLPRQRVHEMCRRRGLMPDAERTLKLLLWLNAKANGRDLG